MRKKIKHSRSRSQKRAKHHSSPHPKGDRAHATLTGQVQKNPRGFAFILPDKKGLPDVFVSPEEASCLMQMDRVEYSVIRKGFRRSAKILKILERRQKLLLGQLIRDRKRLLLVSMDGEPFEILTNESLHIRPSSLNQWAEAEIVDYPTRHQMGQVKVTEILGASLSPFHDIKLAASRFGLSETFSIQALKDCEKAAIAMEEELLSKDGREDLTALPFVTIDGADAKDFDDAIYVERPKQGPAFILYVAIADVSFFVEPGSSVDKEARERGTSTYFPGTCLPMLPERLSNDLCSLRPQIPRFTFTAEIHYDRHAHPIKSHFYRSLIRTAARLTYEQAQRYLQGDPATPIELKTPMESALALFKKLWPQRAQRGVLEFDLPEAIIEVDAKGMPTSVHTAQRLDSHRLIEEFMIAANQATAKALREHHIPTLYRVHENPDPDSLEEINALLRILGVPQRLSEVTGSSLGKLLEATAEHRAHRTIHQTVLRSQKQARYQPEPVGHFGLALRDYTHFTSPIRRYPDLVVHRALKALTQKGKNSDKNKGSLENLDSLGSSTSDAERRSMEAERYIRKRKNCWYMQKQIGKKFRGTVAGLNGKGIFVELCDSLIEGFIKREDLQGYYEFDEDRLCYRKRPGHVQIMIGDPLNVEVLAVTIENNEISFVEATP